MSSDQINTKLFNRGIIQYINNLILLLKGIIYIKKYGKSQKNMKMLIYKLYIIVF